jgi:hypothetical protein
MSDNLGATSTRDTLLEDIAAELTSAVYPVVLRHGMRGWWLDLELGLWRALTETVEHRARQMTPGSPGELDLWRERFLVELTGEAVHVVRSHGVKRSLLGMAPDLYRAFRSAIERDRACSNDATPGEPDWVSDRNVPRRRS